MAKKEKALKDKSQRKPGKKRWIFALFASLAVIATAITLAITYWPAYAIDVSNALLAEQSEHYEEISEFISSHKGEFNSHNKTDYYMEVSSFENVFRVAEKVQTFYTLCSSETIKGKLLRRDIRNIESSLNQCERSLQNMASYLTAHKDEMIVYTVVETAWDSVRDDYKNFLEGYAKLFEKLSQLYSTSELQGVYANDVNILAIDGIARYYKTISEMFFGEVPNSSSGLTISENLGAFADSVYDSSIILNYYLNEDMQTQIQTVKDLESKTKVKLEELFKNNFNITDFSLSQAQMTYVNAAVKFYTGRIEE